ncbi:MAG: DUF4931 domain-containing protein [Nitrospirota bacterium]
MPEIRLNLIARQWVIVEKEKGKRPDDFILKKVKKIRPAFLETCPFCPGNESETPGEILRIHDEKGWRIRIVRNKFSKLSEEGERKRWDSGLKKAANGVGIHEIIVETPVHNLTTATLPVEQLKDVIQVYKDRFTEMYKDPRVEHVFIFKNSGPAAGTNIEHSLSQIVGIPITPPQIRNSIEGFMRFFDETDDCLMCRTLNDELNDERRIVLETKHFVSFVPYAALSAFHIWIFPKRHSGSFADIRSEEIWDLAINLKSTMLRLYYGLNNPDFNYILRSGKPSDTNSGSIHWYLSIVPRVDLATGFELSSGMHINPLLPGMSAEFLRNIKIPEHNI